MDLCCPWESDGVFKDALDNICDNEFVEFLKLPLLLSTFNQIDHAENVEVLIHRA